MASRSIRSIAIAGGGIVGWSAAAALKRRLPAVSVSVIAISPAENALAERVACTLPSIVDFHGDLGLSDVDTVVRAGSGYRLGTHFEGWADTDYVHAYGGYGRSVGSVSFHQLWSRALKEGPVTPFDCYSAAAVIARHNRFAPPEAVARAGLGTIGYGLHIDPPRYREMMRAFGLHLGVAEIEGPICDVCLSGADGFIEMVQAAGHEIRADLYIDATGPAATLRSRLDHEWEDWSEWLPADRILFAESHSTVEPSLLDKAVAAAAGWRWQAATPGRISYGYVYSSSLLTESDAVGALCGAVPDLSPEPPTVIRQGRWSQPWLRNCVAIGDAAVTVEPLEWTNLHLAHGAIDRLVAMMPDRDFSPVELWDYNRQVGAEADRVRDFLVLHYATAIEQSHKVSGADMSVSLPPSLDHTLRQFRERGRLPYYEEETFSRDSWHAILFGQSVIPRRIDPLTDTIPQTVSEKAMAELLEAIATFVDRLPRYSDHLQQLGRKAA